MKLPVVGTHAGGIPEAVVHGDTGLLVPPADPRALAGAIVRLLKDPALRQRMGAAGLACVTDHFGVGNLLTGTLRAYKKAAGIPHPSEPERAPL